MWRINVNGFPWESDITAGNEFYMRCFNEALQIASKTAQTEPQRRVCVRADSFFYSEDRIQRVLRTATRRSNLRFYLMAHATRGENHFVRRLAREHAHDKGWQRYSEMTRLLDLGAQEIMPGMTLPRVILVHERLECTRTVARTKKKQVKERHMVLLANEGRRHPPDALSVYRKYQHRQIQERSFRDSKQGFFKLKFPAQEFQANRFWFHCAMLSQCSLWLYKKEVLPAQPEGLYCKTIRDTLIRVRGKNRGTANHPDARRVQRAVPEAVLGARGGGEARHQNHPVTASRSAHLTGFRSLRTFASGKVAPPASSSRVSDRPRGLARGRSAPARLRGCAARGACRTGAGASAGNRAGSYPDPHG